VVFIHYATWVNVCSELPPAIEEISRRPPMPGCMPSRRSFFVLSSLVFLASAALAQFTGSIQGVVEDKSGAGIGKADVQLVNIATGVVATTTTDASGNYRFLSLAPGSYKVTAEAAGFAKSEADVTLLTQQNLSVPITLKVGSASEAITV